VGEMVNQCVASHQDITKSKSQTLVSQPMAGQFAPNEGLEVWCDEEAFLQILDNLLDNAVRYTPGGGKIEVNWGRGKDFVIIEVRDNGVGIPEADLPRIFERFYRVDKARSKQLGGTGLGLSIVKHLVQAMNGTITATSEVGKGTSFTLQLPVYKQQQFV
jgi:two-component system phosphate regulon sensor histidine kinase PhoR